MFSVECKHLLALHPVTLHVQKFQFHLALTVADGHVRQVVALPRSHCMGKQSVPSKHGRFSPGSHFRGGCMDRFCCRANHMGMGLHKQYFLRSTSVVPYPAIVWCLHHTWKILLEQVHVHTRLLRKAIGLK